MSQDLSTRELFNDHMEKWIELLGIIFNNDIPEKFVWQKNEDIIDICNKIGSDLSLCHTIFPKNGDLDLYGAGTSFEQDCIELYFEENKKCVYLIKPNCLIFQSFGNSYDRAFFRIETKKLMPTNTGANHQGLYEELTEIKPGQYVSISHWLRGFYGYGENGAELPLPDGARRITRWISGPLEIAYRHSPVTING
mgnify:CR=1 FL=1